MTQPSYAGIGSRETPSEVLHQMTVMAAWLTRQGWHLNSGGARGADTAFASGAPTARTLHLPWPGYEGHSGADCHIPAGDVFHRCVALAQAHHPAWHHCSRGARSLHARNVSILLGRDLAAPVKAVICFTRNGHVRGGTGMGIRIARHFGIPVLNLGSMHPRAVCEWMQQILAEA